MRMPQKWQSCQLGILSDSDNGYVPVHRARTCTALLLQATAASLENGCATTDSNSLGFINLQLAKPGFL